MKDSEGAKVVEVDTEGSTELPHQVVVHHCFHFFIGPRSDHSLPMSVTDSLTDSLTTFLKLDVTTLLKIE